MDPQRIVRGPFQLPCNSELVTDPDEEVFLLYSYLQINNVQPHEGQQFRGLGHVDSRKDMLTVRLEYQLSRQTDDTSESIPTGSVKRRRHSKKAQKAGQILDKSVDISLAQDKTALHSRKGDTGSVLWKASVDFATLMLQEFHANSSDSFLIPSILKTLHIVELGAGTGLLAIAISPLVRRYTVTDIADLVPLLRKNMALNFEGWPNCLPSTPGSNIFVDELDWVLLHSTKVTHRPRLFDSEPIDLLLIVDAIYHPSLLPALVDTIHHLATPDQTVVLVVVELRADDVIREFLQLWLGKPGWEVWRIGDGLLQKPYAMWLGSRRPVL